MLNDDTSVCLNHSACPNCRASGKDRSGDNLANYSDGHGYCFACGYYAKANACSGDNRSRNIEGEGESVFDLGGPTRCNLDTLTPASTASTYAGPSSQSNLSENPNWIDPVSPIRSIPVSTLRKFGYQINPEGTKQAAHYRSRIDNSVSASHIRVVEPKDFYWIGSNLDLQLYGQHLWPSGGRRVVVTEGELDAMSISAVQQDRWPVVSIPNGVKSATSSIRQNLDWLTTFGEVVFAFDHDAAGQAAAQQCALLLPAGKARIATLPLKDANEMLRSGRAGDLVSCLWNASTYYPDDILDIDKIEDHVLQPMSTDDIWHYPWKSLSKRTLGARKGEIVLWTSGTGSGKSTILRSLALDHVSKGRSVGMVMLEENPEDTKLELMSFKLGHPIRICKAMQALGMIQDLPYTEAQAIAAKEFVDKCSKLKIYRSNGEKAFERLLSMLQYMAISQELDVIIIDHINVIATASSASSEIQDRQAINNLLQEIRSIVIRTGVHMDVICQLKKGDKAFEEGDDITLQDLKGSGDLMTVPDTIIAMIRNRQQYDGNENVSVLKILKNRLAGWCGTAAAIEFDMEKMSFIEREFGFADGQVVLKPKEETKF